MDVIGAVKKLDWAPLDTPLNRRLQTFSVIIFTYVIWLTIFFNPCLYIYTIFFANIYLKVIIVTFSAYIYWEHKKTASVRNGNSWMFWRSNFVWRNFRSYFPIELVKTAELPPNRNYLLAGFPHGIIGVGISCNMCADIDKWLELYPGVRPKLGTLNMHFITPLVRELLRAWGLISVSKESLLYYLSRSNDPQHEDNKDGFTSNAVAVLVGGAQEALDSRPGQYILTLKNRKGFVKLAIRTGSPIVPSFSFGEVDVFRQVDNPPDSFLRKFQSYAKKLTDLAPVMIVGRGIFQYNFGLLPQRKRIVQVVGAPIEIEQSDNPTPEYVDEVHKKVMDAVVDMFETYKDKYLDDPDNAKLEIV